MLRLVPRARPISSRLFQTTRFYSSHHDHHHSNDHNGTPAQNSTGWPRPSGRSPVRPYERDQVAIQLAKTTHQTPEEVIELEGWLFGKKVIYLNSEKPYYEQIPNDDVQFMFGERVRKSIFDASFCAYNFLASTSWTFPIHV